jgi:hypothetical protein
VKGTLKLPANLEHTPYGREYMNAQDAQAAIEQFNVELDKLLERYGVHSFIFNGSLMVKSPSAPVPTPEGGLFGQILTRAICRADGCKSCTMWSVAQGAVFSPDQNEILTGAYAMLESALREQQASEQAAAFEKLEVKGPRQ